MKTLQFNAKFLVISLLLSAAAYAETDVAVNADIKSSSMPITREVSTTVNIPSTPLTPAAQVTAEARPSFYDSVKTGANRFVDNSKTTFKNFGSDVKEVSRSAWQGTKNGVHEGRVYVGQQMSDHPVRSAFVGTAIFAGVVGLGYCIWKALSN